MNNFKNKKITPNAQKLRKKMTPWERKLWYQFLRQYPVQFHRQKVMKYYVVDFYCPQAMLVVELDGGGHYTPEQMEYDRRRTKYLESLNLKVVRFSNYDVDNNFYGVCTVIDEMVTSGATPHPSAPLPPSPRGEGK